MAVPYIIGIRKQREGAIPMKYDFTSVMDRHGRDAIAVDMVGKPGGFAPG
jgi:hypothetical protein